LLLFPFPIMGVVQVRLRSLSLEGVQFQEVLVLEVVGVAVQELSSLSSGEEVVAVQELSSLSSGEEVVALEFFE
jgi:hypothetical protein